MKWMLLFFVASIVQLQANVSYSQTAKLTLNIQNETVQKVLSTIEKQSDFYFTYNLKQINLDQVVSIRAEQEEISKVLDQLFQNQSVKYSIKDKHIVLYKADAKEATLAATQQQEKVISGTVVDSAGEPLTGVSVAVKGTTLGTVTDFEGKYTLKVPDPSASLTFTYIGYKPQTLTPGASGTLNITLEEDTHVIQEVVVTALGIKREQKSLTYNVQELKSSEVTGVRDASFVNSLAGKVAGVQISTSSSGIGGSTRVIMRGTKSLFGRNDALYVVDGIPLASLKTEQPDNIYEVPDGGDADGISNINPDDIESMSVLTGSAAAALYGSQGANGVVLITTKKGKEGKLRVTYSNSTTFMQPFMLPEFQNTYGSNEGEFASWGQKLETPTSYDPADFFQTGYNETNSVSFSVGSEKNQTYGSVSAVNARGIIPNNEYNRYNFSVRNTSVLIENRLNLDLNFSYMNQDDQNMRAQGMYHNPLVPIYLFPRGDDIEKYKMYKMYKTYDPERNFQVQNWYYGNLGLGMQNPYWIVNNSMFNNERNRYMMSAGLQCKITDWMEITGRVFYDNAESDATRKISASSDKLFASDWGNYYDAHGQNQQLYADAILNINKPINDNFKVVANLGGSFLDRRYELRGYEGHLFPIADKFHYDNIAPAGSTYGSQTEAHQDIWREQIQAVFGTFQLGYKSMIFLDVTARNDWASMLLGTKQDNIFYPSVGLSAVFSDMFDMSKAGVSFLKGRLSYSEVGNAPERYITMESWAMNAGSMPSTGTAKPATDLEAERTRSFEAGLDVKFLKNKISIGSTYYNSNTYNQLFSYTPSLGSGYARAYLNAGKVNNYGVEATLGYKQKIVNVDWNSSFTYTINRNEIKELIPEGTIDEFGDDIGTKSMTIGSSIGGYQMKLVEGQSVGDIYVTGLAIDEHGYIRVNPNTKTIAADNVTPIRAGNANPLYSMGWRNSFSFKGFELNFLVDAKVGGVVVSATQSILDQYGVSKATADARDAGGVWVNGGLLSYNNYYNVVAGGATLAPYVYDATTVRLREAMLSYTLPQKWFNNKLQGVVLSVTGRNLFMIYSKAPYDTDLTASTGTYYQGYDYFMPPGLRSFGFGVKVLF